MTAGPTLEPKRCDEYNPMIGPKIKPKESATSLSANTILYSP